MKQTARPILPARRIGEWHNIARREIRNTRVAGSTTSKGREIELVGFASDKRHGWGWNLGGLGLSGRVWE